MVMVVFTPLAVGSRIANFIFSTNDQNELNLSNLVMGVGAPAVTQYQLQTSAVGPGTIQQTPSGTLFNANTSITLTAVPNANSSFTSWSGACTGSTNTVCMFSITANTTVTATFAANPALVIPQGQQSGAAGNTFTFQINETGFTTQPTLTASCSIPNGACSISGSTLIVTTAARSSSFVALRFPAFPVGLLLTLAILMFGASPRGNRMFRRAILVGGLTALAACGGGSSSSQNSGTPAGTYTVTIHATAGTQTAITTVSVIVQ